MEKKIKRYQILFYVYYFVVFLGAGLQGSFMNLYLNNAGMQPGLISILSGLTSLLSLFTTMLWGGWADKAKSRNVVLVASLCLTVVVLVAFYYARQIWMLAILMVLFSAVSMPSAGIYETITMDYCTRNSWRYSPIRMSGTIGYAVMAVVAGFWLSKVPELLFPIYITVMLLATVCAMLLPKSVSTKLSDSSKVKKDKGSVKEVFGMLKDKQLLHVMILLMIYTMSLAYNNVHFSIFMKEFCSVDRAILLSGVAHMVMALAEIPFHIGPGSRWLKKIGIEKSLCIVMAAGAVRYLLCAICPNEWVLVGTMAFNGIMLVPTIVAVVEFIYSRSPEHLKTTAQTALRTPFNLCGNMIATFGIGSLATQLTNNNLPGIRIGYAIFVPLCLIGGLMVAIPIFKREKAEKLAAAASVNKE